MPSTQGVSSYKINSYAPQSTFSYRPPPPPGSAPPMMGGPGMMGYRGGHPGCRPGRGPAGPGRGSASRMVSDSELEQPLRSGPRAPMMSGPRGAPPMM